MRSLLYTVAAVAILSQVDGKFKCVYEGLYFIHFYSFDAIKKKLHSNYILSYPSLKSGNAGLSQGLKMNPGG